MEDWVLWVIGGGILAVGEMLSVTFFLGPIALAAIAGAATALLGGGAALQIVVFIVAAIASVGVLRPVARRHVRLPAPLRTGSAALVGRQRRCWSGWTTAAGRSSWQARSGRPVPGMRTRCSSRAPAST